MAIARHHPGEKHHRRADRERFLRDKQFGAAVAALRNRCGLRQVDVKGLSAWQVRRIEKGESASASALEELAEAHGLEANEYLEAIARAITSNA